MPRARILFAGAARFAAGCPGERHQAELLAHLAARWSAPGWKSTIWATTRRTPAATATASPLPPGVQHHGQGHGMDRGHFTVPILATTRPRQSIRIRPAFC